MGQMGFFDVSKRYAGLDAKADPLVKLNEMVPWADLRLYIAYTQAAGIIGNDVSVWRDILESAIKDALGRSGPTCPGGA